MSKQDTSLSKSQLDLLKQFKKQVTAPQTKVSTEKKSSKQPIYTSPQAEQENDTQLFNKAMQGVQEIDRGNLAIEATQKSHQRLNAQMLAKRIAAEGTTETDETILSDTQALLNPVASQAFLSYRITTLQNRVFEDLKAGKLRWFEAVDLHGCTIEQARIAVLQLIQMAKDDHQNVIKIVHGKGPTGILKTCVNGWLRQHKDILAFVSAPENQGGTGAVLVLLKRTEKNPKYQQERK
ncbi:DNA mismatch repair protein MutS [Acinetobacter qingfengensis]|uniref:DNA mismatch repair protein MutS n=1 Tax=Acinetobacter qingfengensis TaxID=1262585 RepID=A0A1E7RCK4_9GAMM|nr:Smr/MutS family protein [Acinetobacter qingfengensis]KAA8735242.1 DNA mismatch repair protein MutS [Acinetobacter qingfengensis]OEY96982.1 DNA mismatch repair protein MutS [Acinetobacter qingfengensis]